MLCAVSDKDGAPAPCAIRCRAASSLIFPAPTSKTLLSASDPKIFCASSTATETMETEQVPIWVSLLTLLATMNVR